MTIDLQSSYSTVEKNNPEMKIRLRLGCLIGYETGKLVCILNDFI